jgi:tripartite-type tricarboxylate transporter receptor subunit TctC
MSMRSWEASAVAACALLIGAGSALADPVEDFYRGRTLTVYISTEPGGGYDLYGRLFATHIGPHIPGKPAVVAKNMPGGGGLVMTNWLYGAAPKDGSAVAGATQALAIEQVLGSKGIQYDAQKFSWIGRMAPVVEVSYTWYTSPTKSFEDARRRETVMGATGPTSPTFTYLKQLNVLAGTKFKAITGFPGTTDANLAMERGEVEGTTKSWASLKVDNAQWLAEKKINLLLQYATERSPELPDVPLQVELGRTELDRAALRFLTAGNAMGRSIMGPPGIPPERLAALRKAYLEMMTDPDFLADATKRRIDIGALSGERLQKLVEDTLAVSPDALARVRQARGE